MGTPFHGFALQGEVPTVARALGEALGRVLRHPVELTCAGRTDAGVHAWGQVVSLDAEAGADLARLQRSVNKMLAPFVVVREAAWASADFDARRSRAIPPVPLLPVVFGVARSVHRRHHVARW